MTKYIFPAFEKKMEVYVSSLGNHGVRTCTLGVKSNDINLFLKNRNNKDADLEWKHAVPGIIWGEKYMRGKYIYTLLRHCD